MDWNCIKLPTLEDCSCDFNCLSKPITPDDHTEKINKMMLKNYNDKSVYSLAILDPSDISKMVEKIPASANITAIIIDVYVHVSRLLGINYRHLKLRVQMNRRSVQGMDLSPVE